MILSINHIVYEKDDSYYITRNERIELTEESEKALTDLIDQRIDKRLEKNKLTRFKEWLKDTEDYYSES